MVAHVGCCQPGPGSWGRCTCARAWVPSSVALRFTSQTRNLDEKLKVKCPDPVERAQKSVSPSKAGATWKWGRSIKNGRCIKKKRPVEVCLLHRVCPVPLWSQGPHTGRLTIRPSPQNGADPLGLARHRGGPWLGAAPWRRWRRR